MAFARFHHKYLKVFWGKHATKITYQWVPYGNPIRDAIDCCGASFTSFSANMNAAILPLTRCWKNDIDWNFQYCYVQFEQRHSNIILYKRTRTHIYNENVHNFFYMYLYILMWQQEKLPTINFIRYKNLLLLNILLNVLRRKLVHS